MRGAVLNDGPQTIAEKLTKSTQNQNEPFEYAGSLFRGSLPVLASLDSKLGCDSDWASLGLEAARSIGVNKLI